MGSNERNTSSLAWRLSHYLDHLEDLSARYDMRVQDLEESEVPEVLYRTREYSELPNPIQFYAISDAVPYTDYPHNDIRWPIMSERMLEVLLGVREFPHRTYSIEVVDIGVAPVGDTNFVAVQLITHQDYFDWERSAYQMGRSQRMAVSIDEFVINFPAEGPPPLFRLSAAPTYLFISDEARQTLREAGIRGTSYLPMDGFISEEDLPLVIPTRSSQAT